MEAFTFINELCISHSPSVHTIISAMRNFLPFRIPLNLCNSYIAFLGKCTSLSMLDHITSTALQVLLAATFFLMIATILLDNHIEPNPSMGRQVALAACVFAHAIYFGLATLVEGDLGSISGVEETVTQALVQVSRGSGLLVRQRISGRDMGLVSVLPGLENVPKWQI